jgi:hypothetical protein
MLLDRAKGLPSSPVYAGPSRIVSDGTLVSGLIGVQISDAWATGGTLPAFCPKLTLGG